MGDERPDHSLKRAAGKGDGEKPTLSVVRFFQIREADYMKPALSEQLLEPDGEPATTPLTARLASSGLRSDVAGPAGSKSTGPASVGIACTCNSVCRCVPVATCACNAVCTCNRVNASYGVTVPSGSSPEEQGPSEAVRTAAMARRRRTRSRRRSSGSSTAMLTRLAHEWRLGKRRTSSSSSSSGSSSSTGRGHTGGGGGGGGGGGYGGYYAPCF